MLNPANQANNLVNNPNPNPNPVNPPNPPNPLPQQLTVTARAMWPGWQWCQDEEVWIPFHEWILHGLEGIPMMQIWWHLQLMDATDP